MSARETGDVDTFFYGLFMDEALLRGKGCTVLGSRRARLDGHRLSIGRRATLLPAEGRTVHGVLMRMRRDDLERLYSEESVRAYQASSIRVSLTDGGIVDALTYVLPEAQHQEQPNAEYAGKLHRLGVQLGLPREYLQEISDQHATRREP
jgi:cation transport regulator ChaC